MKERLPRGSEIFGSWIIWGCIGLDFGYSVLSALCWLFGLAFIRRSLSREAGLSFVRLTAEVIQLSFALRASFAARHSWSFALRASLIRLRRMSFGGHLLRCHLWSFALRASFMVIRYASFVVICAARVIQGQLCCARHSGSVALRVSFMVICASRVIHGQLRCARHSGGLVLPIDFM